METSNSVIAVGCLAVVAVVAMSFVKGAERRRLLHKERMSAIEKGVPLPEDLLAEGESSGTPGTAARRAALAGTIWISLGLGMVAAYGFSRHLEFGPDMRQLLSFLQVWAYPAMFVGLGLLVFAFFSREKKR